MNADRDPETLLLTWTIYDRSPEYSEDTLADVLAEDKLCKELLHGGELAQARSHHQRDQVPSHSVINELKMCENVMILLA